MGVFVDCCFECGLFGRELVLMVVLVVWVW